MILTKAKRRVRTALKRLLYSQLYQRDAFMILFGKAKPLIMFKVEATPPSMYFNFEIKPEKVAGLQQELDLPYPLSPIECLEGEEPFYCLTLNIYRVSGLANGMRAEWSLYIRDKGGTPRYLVVEANADAGSLDPVNLFTKPGHVTHVREGEWLTSEAGCAKGGVFRARCRAPEEGEVVTTARQWTEANDYIYWMNGICDRTFYDSGLANPRTRRIAAADFEIEDTTDWARLVEPNPRHVIVFEDEIEFAMSPWWNLADLGS